MQSQIQCPDCSGIILLDTQLLLAGQSFMCAKCGARVALANECKSQVSQAMAEFEQLRAQREGVAKAADDALKAL